MKHYADPAFRRRWVLSNLLIALFSSLFAQDIAIGTWRTHFSYDHAKHLAITSDKVFCATDNGFFSRVIATGETRKLSKIDGLSDVGISALAFNTGQNVLVIGYRSGFIDFVFEDQILSIDDLAKTNLDVGRSINGILFYENRTYLATDLGIIVVETSTAEIKENFVNIGAGGVEASVTEIELRNDSLFIITDDGIQSGSLDENLLDFGNWNRYPGTGSYANLVKVEGDLYATSGTDLIQFASTWDDTGIDLPSGANRLFALDGSLLTADDNGNLYRLTGSAFELETTLEAYVINDLVGDGLNQFFATDQGLIDQNGNVLSPEGPVSDVFSNFRVINNELFGFHAPSPFSHRGNIQQRNFSVFTEGTWAARSIDGFTNVSDVAVFNNNYYFSSIGDGIYSELTGEVLKDIPGSASQLDTVITALAGAGSLWVSSFGNINPIHLLSGDNTWSSYSSAALADDEFLTIDLSETEFGWLGSSSGFITVLDPIEQDVEILNTTDGLPSSFIDIDIGVEDNAWVATSRGPAVFPDASFIFFSSEAILPTFDNRILFDGEAINAVMTDGGNRIWFGTNNGVWVYDENTSEQVAVFNEENSPLPSNRIIQLAYNRRNGEVFIYTDKGMVSYRSASSVGSRNHRNVQIFPNPVRPDYQGLVGLTGLARNASVKVTDINGNLVKEISANGGTASWDLMDVRGREINTGVYLFFSASSDGEETFVGKLAVIR